MDRRRFLTGAVAGVAVAVMPRTVEGQTPMSLQQLIDTAPDGTPSSPTIVDGGGQVFTSEDTVRVIGRHWLTLRNFTLNADTDGTTAFPWLPNRWPRNRSHLRIEGGSTNILVDTVTVTGPHPTGGSSSLGYVAAFEAQMGFDIDGANTVTIRNCKVFDVYGDFVYIRSSNVVVEDCVFARNGRQGITIVEGLNNRVSRCVMDEMARATFNIEPNLDTSVVDGVIIEDCSTGRGRLLWFTIGGSTASTIRNVTFRRNVQRLSTGTPVLNLVAPAGSTRGPFTITDNVTAPTGSPNPVVNVLRIAGLTFTGNTVAATPSRAMTGVLVRESTGVKFARNTFVGTATDIQVN